MTTSKRFLGIDVGAETVKIVELRRHGGALEIVDKRLSEHSKDPTGTLQRMLGEMD